MSSILTTGGFVQPTTGEGTYDMIYMMILRDSDNQKWMCFRCARRRVTCPPYQVPWDGRWPFLEGCVCMCVCELLLSQKLLPPSLCFHALLMRSIDRPIVLEWYHQRHEMEGGVGVERGKKKGWVWESRALNQSVMLILFVGLISSFVGCSRPDISSFTFPSRVVSTLIYLLFFDVPGPALP